MLTLVAPNAATAAIGKDSSSLAFGGSVYSVFVVSCRSADNVSRVMSPDKIFEGFRPEGVMELKSFLLSAGKIIPVCV